MFIKKLRLINGIIAALWMVLQALPASAHVDTGGNADTRDHNRQVIGYITNWDAWKGTDAGLPAQGALNHLNIDYNKYTLLNFAFFGVAQDGSLHSGDHRNKNIYMDSAVQDPADLFHTDIYSSWDLHLLFGEIEPVYYLSDDAVARCRAQGFVVSAGGNTWEHSVWGLGGSLPVPLHKEGGAPGLLEEAHDKGVKVLASIGGWSMSKHFSDMAADPVKRARFIRDCATLINTGFDGIDLDWEYPGPFTGMNFTGTDDDYVNYLTLVRELRNTLGSDALITGAFAAPYEKISGFEWDKLSQFMDYFNFMTYDFNGGWSDMAGFNSNLFDYPGSETPDWNWSSVMDSMAALNIPKSKVCFGVPFYGRGVVCESAASLNAATAKRNEFIQPDGPIVTSADYTNWPENVYDGTPTFFFIKQVALASGSGWVRFWEDSARVPFLVKDNYFLSYEDEASMGEKAQFVVDNDLAGVIVWTVFGDLELSGTPTRYGSKLQQWSQASSPLVNTINEVFAKMPVAGEETDSGASGGDSSSNDDTNDDMGNITDNGSSTDQSGGDIDSGTDSDISGDDDGLTSNDGPGLAEDSNSGLSNDSSGGCFVDGLF